MKEFQRRYIWETVVVILAYAVILAISRHVLRLHWPAPQRYLLAITPIVPLLFLPPIFLRLFRSIDELRQRIHLEAFAFTFAASAIVTFGYGLLQGEGMPKLTWVWVYPVMWVFWLIGLVLARRRYR